MEEQFTARHLGDIPRVAEELLALVDLHGVVVFYGEMGAGKTTLIREMCAQLGVTDNVTSPTFALVNEYRTADGEPVFHFDFYRITRIEELFDLGYEEYFASGCLCLVEWPEKMGNLLPSGVTEICIDGGEDGERSITVRSAS
jgi:tRNA threonylcarbamoyladenosine biosynthesis protein TsaE